MPPSTPTPAGTIAPTDQPPPVVSAREKKLIARMLKKVSAVRGLQSKHEVPGATLARDALIARVKSHVAKEVPREAIRREGLVLQLLGLVPTQFDYEAETFALLEAQLAGFYEPSDGYMYLAGDLDEDNASATLAHELVHALQDQHFDLKSRSKYRPGEGDLSLASSALAEGDATSAMVDILVEGIAPDRSALELPDDFFEQQILASVNMGSTAHVPHIMKTSLVAPYVDGTLFIHALRRRGGWAAVNRAWQNPPTTSEQILHPEKWERHEPALTVSEPLAVVLGPGWAATDRDTYGELGTRLSFAEWMDDKDAKKAASGWGGDRGALFQNGAQAAFAWRLRYDEEPFAARARAALGPAMESKIGRAGAKDGPSPAGAPPIVGGEFLCIERADLGPIAIARTGRDLVVTAGPTTTGAKWTSSGSCALARKWTQAILTTP